MPRKGLVDRLVCIVRVGLMAGVALTLNQRVVGSSPKGGTCDRGRPIPSRAVISNNLRRTSSAPSSRPGPPTSEQVRPSTATQIATRMLPDDPDLAAVVAAWPGLPDAIRAGILAMVRAASQEGRRR